MKKSVFVSWLILAVSHILFMLVDGYSICVDSSGYIEMAPGREPGYSLWLAFFRTIFGHEGYFTWVLLAQIALAIFASCYLITTLAKELGLSNIDIYVLTFIYIASMCIYRWGSKQGSIFPCLILTEGLTYSLIYIWVAVFIKLLIRNNKKYLIIFTLVMFMLFSVRTHMIVVAATVVSFAFLLAVIYRKEYLKRFILLSMSAVIAVAFSFILQYVYIFSLYGDWNGMTGKGAYFIVSDLYYAVENDRDLYDDSALFDEVYGKVKEAGLVYENAENEGLIGKAFAYANSYDQIKYDILLPTVENNVDKTNTAFEQIREQDEMIKALDDPIRLKHLDKRVTTFVGMMLLGYVRTIGKAGRMFYVIEAILYVLFICVLVNNLIKSRSDDANIIINWLSILVLLFISVNIVFTDLIIFCEPRYMLYGFSLFYMMLYLQVRMLRNK